MDHTRCVVVVQRELPNNAKWDFSLGEPEIHVGGDLETCCGSLEKDTEASCPTIKRCDFLEVVGLTQRGFNGGAKSRRQISPPTNL